MSDEISTEDYTVIQNNTNLDIIPNIFNPRWLMFR